MAFGSDNKVQYKYVISSLKIKIPEHDTIVVTSGQINNFLIEKDYDADTYPIFHLNLKLTPSDIYTILENKTTVRFFISLQTYGFDDNDNVFRYKDVVFNESFGIFIDDNSAQLDKDLYDMNKSLSMNNDDNTNLRTNYDFFLFKDSDLAVGKSIVNKVLSNVDMTNAVTYLLSVSGAKNVLMSKMDNHTTYDSVCLLPVPTIQNITYLNNQYGFYNHGACLFFDLDRTYLIDKRGEATCYERDEYSDVILYCFKKSSTKSISGGCYIDHDNHTYNVNIPFSAVEMHTMSVIEDQITSTKVLSVNPESGEASDISPEIQHRGTGNTRVLVNNFKNQYMENELKYRKEESDAVVKVCFNGINMNMMTPNKRYILVFEDINAQGAHGGTYRLSKVLFDFKSEGSEFNTIAYGTFYKIK